MVVEYGVNSCQQEDQDLCIAAGLLSKPVEYRWLTFFVTIFATIFMFLLFPIVRAGTSCVEDEKEIGKTKNPLDTLEAEGTVKEQGSTL